MVWPLFLYVVSLSELMVLWNPCFPADLGEAIGSGPKLQAWVKGKNGHLGPFKHFKSGHKATGHSGG